MNLNAQEVLIRQFPGLDTLPKNYGPNRDSYFAGLIGYGHFFGPSDSSAADLNVPRSIYISYGYRTKFKLSEGFNLGSDFLFEYRNYNIKQSSTKEVFGPTTHRKERLLQGSVAWSLFARINFSKRGNHLGKYLDFFGAIHYTPINRYLVFDRLDDSTGAKMHKQVYTRLQFTQKLYTQVGIRYGISFFQLQVFYRPTNLFKRKNDFPFPELPRFGAGILIDIDQSDQYKD